jgi:hypothetical protein
MFMTQSDHLRRVRFWLAVFIIGLVLSGVTAFPLETELSLLVSIFHAGWLRPISEFTGMLPCLGDHLKTGHLWSVQNRPLCAAENVTVLPCFSLSEQGLI